MIPGFDIALVTADEPYSGLWHTQLIYTEYLASHNEVIFMDPPKKWNVSHLFDLTFKLKEKQVNKNLTVVSYRNILPSSFNVFNEWYNQFLIRRKLKKKKVQSVLIWHFDSFRNSFNQPRFVNTFQVKRIYHVIDPFMANPNNTLLCQLANLIVITSPRNNQHYSDYKNKLINIPQVINLELTRELVAGPLKPGLPLKENFIVLLGTISDDVDFEWLLELTASTSVNLLFIGKTAGIVENKMNFNTLLSRPNVEYLGMMSPAEFYPILKKAKAGIIVYNSEKRTKAFSSLKTVNYLVANIPTITNIDSEISSLDGMCIYTEAGIAEFKATLMKAIEGTLPFDVSSANSYLTSISLQKAVDTILSKI